VLVGWRGLHGIPGHAACPTDFVLFGAGRQNHASPWWLVEFRRFFGKEPGIALLAGLLSIKLLETNSVRTHAR
jgi:hypothetical protein